MVVIINILYKFITTALACNALDIRLHHKHTSVSYFCLYLCVCVLNLLCIKEQLRKHKALSVGNLCSKIRHTTLMWCAPVNETMSTVGIVLFITL